MKPYIIAFSRKEGENEKMMNVGADAAIEKVPQLTDVLKVIREIERRAKENAKS